LTIGRSVRATLVRATPPFWAHAPSSGAGAAKYGGRFNPVGVPALYMSFDFATAAREVRFALNTNPYTFYFIEVDCADVADLTDPASLAASKIDPTDLEAPNWESEMRRGARPATHRIAAALIRDGFAGIIVRSFAPGALPGDKNLVLWKWEDVRATPSSSPHRIRVLGRERLPMTTASWPTTP
jgi:RES domain-containing protein